MQKIIKLSYTLLLLALIDLGAYAQSVEITGVLIDCKIDSVRLFELDGSQLRPLAAAPLELADGTYKFQLNLDQIPEGFYMLGGGNPQDTKTLIVGKESGLKLTGPCNTLNRAKVWDSPINKDYSTIMKRADGLQQAFSRQVNAYRSALRQGSDLAPVEAEMRKIDAQKLQLLDSLKAAQPFLAKALALRTYLSFQSENNDDGKYKNESEFFAKTYFRFVDFKDPAYNHMPEMHNAFRTYANSLTRVGLSNQAQQAFLNNILKQIPSNTSAHKLALIGSISGLKSGNNDAYVALAKEFIQKYGRQQPSYAAQLQKDLASMQAQLIGGEAPEIRLPNPEGDTLSLRSLRGKVVLIDFWASWCGPCRRENPNVVRVYNKYKDKGFEILGVSLDRTKASWLKAIEKDGLEWLHVSDLKYWQSIAAKSYGVSAIPHTVLLDQEGKILATKLRSRALEQKLAEIFGGEGEE